MLSSEYEVDADADDVTVKVAGWAAEGTVGTVGQGVVEGFLCGTDEYAVIATGGVYAFVFAFQHDVGQQVVVQAQSPGVLPTSIVVQLGVSHVSEELLDSGPELQLA